MNNYQQSQQTLMNCNECQHYFKGCEENCPYELKTESIQKPSRLRTRKLMKAFKCKELQKSKVKVSVASSKLKEGERKNNHPQVVKQNQAQKELEKAIKRNNRRVEKNHQRKKVIREEIE